MTSLDLFTAIAQAERPTIEVDFPRRGADGNPIGHVAIRVLTETESLEAAAEADRTARALLREMPKQGEAHKGYDSVYANAVAVEILWRACRDVTDATKTLAPSAGALRDALTTDEIGVLMNLYASAQEQLGPFVVALSREEADAWAVRFEKSGVLEMEIFTPDALKSVARALARRNAELAKKVA